MKIPNCLQIEATYTRFASGTMKAMFAKDFGCRQNNLSENGGAGKTAT